MRSTTRICHVAWTTACSAIRLAVLHDAGCAQPPQIASKDGLNVPRVSDYSVALNNFQFMRRPRLSTAMLMLAYVGTLCGLQHPSLVTSRLKHHAKLLRRWSCYLRILDCLYKLSTMMQQLLQLGFGPRSRRVIFVRSLAVHPLEHFVSRESFPHLMRE